MKWMKKLRLINWHYFSDETMEFGKQTLITGQNAAGKSTIIDALQVLFIASQRQIRFNPAAHEEAKRSMVDYLKGKIGSDERTFLRDGDFNTYMAAEFRDEEKKESFVIGVVIDVFSDQRYEEEYFILGDTRLDQVDFVKPSGHLRNREEFRGRHHILAGSGKNRTFFERNKSNYQKALLSRMGQLHDRFFSVFSKALSFKPLHNVRDFVYDYILDRRELQLDLMKHNFEIHEKYEQELRALQKRKEALVEIREKHNQFEKLRETVNEQDYVVRRLKWNMEQENLETQEREKEQIESVLIRLDSDIALALDKRDEAQRESETALTRWKSHDAVRRKEQLESVIAEQGEKENQLMRTLKVMLTALREETQLLDTLLGWNGNEAWIWHPSELEGLRDGAERTAAVMSALEHSLSGGESAELAAEQFNESVADRLRETGSHLQAIHERMLKTATRLEDRLTQADQQIASLEKIIHDLENRKRTYPPSVAKLKSLLETSLGSRSEVWIFCEEVEIEDEAWRDAAEGYLNTQRFDLLVNPEVFAEALTLYERDKFTHQLEGVGLVDTEKEQRYLGTSEADSLAHALKSDNPIVRAHLEHLLGRVMRAGDEQELRKHKTAITKTCMVYNRLVARQIPRKQYELPYIGAKAIVRQLEMKRQELADVRQEQDQLKDLLQQMNHWTERLNEKKSQYVRLAEQLQLPAQLAVCREALAAARAALDQLDMSEADRLKETYESWRKTQSLWNGKWVELEKDKTGREADKKQLVSAMNIQSDKVREAHELFERWSREYDPDTLQRAQARWTEAEKQDVPTYRKIENWLNNQKGNATRRDDGFRELELLRQRYNIDYTFGGEISAADNEAYETLLHTIDHLNIPEYQQKVEQSLKDSEEEFKSHFVFKLREAIEIARREFHELNHALKHFPFSDDRYHFEVSPNEKYRKFYDAIMDPMLAEKGSLFDIPDPDRSATLHELFELLVRGEAGDLEEFTDYRRYLDFDMIVHSHGSQFRFSKVLKEKSGGETQTPFYIAILASFHHLYSSGKTSRLVVFDEAFNKMDEQRIQSSLRLIKQLNLQLIAAVPDEKMQHMVPEVTTTLIVTNQNYRCFVDMIDRWDEEPDTTPDNAAKIGGGADESEEPIRQDILF